MTPEQHLRVSGAQLYESIGSAYPATRRTEPRIAARVWEALGDARAVLNVGAGTGSYEYILSTEVPAATAVLGVSLQTS